MKETIKLGVILLVITAVAGGVLAVSNSYTAPIIEEIHMKESLGAFFDIFPDADDFVEIDEGLLEDITSDNEYVKEVYEVMEGDDLIGYGFKTVSGGFEGDITTVIGIDIEGTMAGIKVTDNNETPGLGAKIAEEDFSDSFKDKTTEEELVHSSSPSEDNEVQTVSGATASTEGVLTGVNGAREVYIDYLAN